MNFHNPQILPVIPERIRRERHVYEPLDTRFRAAARLLQAMWRERHNFGPGYYVDRAGVRRRLGSALAPADARAGANFVHADIFSQTRCELAYREPGALLDANRVLSNLLSSMPLVFNLLVPLKTDKSLARRVFSKLAPGVAKRIAHVQFEHSPGRGDATFTADGTAFDAFVSACAPEGGKTFLAIEVKYTESMTEPEARLRTRYDELSRSSGLFVRSEDEALRRNPLQQLWRQHMLAQAMVDCGLYDGGVYMLIAPLHNWEVQRAVRRYIPHLRAAEGKVAFINIVLEDAIEAIRRAGASEHADALYERYCNFSPVHEIVRAECFSTPRRKRPSRVTARPRRPGPPSSPRDSAATV